MFDMQKTLVLIPCCKSKVALLSEGWEAPLQQLDVLREQLLCKIEDTTELLEKDTNLRGILNPYATVTRAIDLYVGNFYYVAGDILHTVADGEIPDVDVLIVSAFYGLVQLNEGIKKYELQMGDNLHDGTKVYKYWQEQGLWKILQKYVIDNDIRYVWSLLPDSLPSFPYQQVFNKFWKESQQNGIECYHVKVPGAGTSTGYQRAKWLNEVLMHDPSILASPSLIPQKFENIPGHNFEYHYC